jgi:acetate---CoA ligase (ADP-forming)
VNIAAKGSGGPPERDLRTLFDPVSIAIVGASDDERKWGNWLARAALTGPRPLHLVNPGRDTVLGRPAYRSVSDTPGPVGLVAICVPARQVAAAVEDALAAGARAIAVISAGFGETGPAGQRLEHDIACRVRDAGSLLLGPNCLGVFDAGSGLCLTSNPLPAGRVAFLSQSGNLSLDLAGLLAEHGLGFSRFASLGNQADVDLPELVEACADHDPTDVVAIYCEQFTDGRRFVAAARDVGKPVVLLSAGSGAASARVAASHTGSMVPASAAVDAACVAAGVHRVHSPGELADLLALLAAPARPAGRRLAILTDGGGHAAVAAELAGRSGLDVPALSDVLRARVGRQLPGHAGTSNPVDVAGGAEQDLHCLVRVADDLLGSGEVDALLLSGYFGGYGEYGPAMAAAELAVAERLGEVVLRTGRPLAVQTLFPQGPVAAALRAHGIPVFRRVESATVGLGRLAPGARPGCTVPDPRPAPATTAARAAATTAAGNDYWSARQLLATAGVPFPAAMLVAGRAGLDIAAGRLRPPWVLKANGLPHKSDAGGVRMGLRDVSELATAYDDLVRRLAPVGCVLEETAEAAGGVELIAGVRRDPHFGPVAMVGIGGVYTELLADVQVGLAPLAPGQVLAMLSRLRGAALLTGARGRPRLAIEAAAQVIALVCEVAAEHLEIAELEVNPLLVTTAGALALDARVGVAAPVSAGGGGAPRSV